MLDKDSKQSQIATLAKYWRTHRGTHTIYALKFFFCEFLNFANVIAQVRPFKPGMHNIRPAENFDLARKDFRPQ